MNDFDLSDLDLNDLKKLHKETAAAIQSYEARRRQEALAAAEAAAKAAGYSLKDLVGASTEKSSKSINPPKYRNPDDKTQTWSGRGRQPQWIKDALAANKSLDDFLIVK
ncbi:H-NS histone family protein [Limimaricola cinnabarinus]|uniref:Trans-acting regulatory protein hvrA n=1 Tax=Limimaricola cinnabarinus LL-001 TaxID=1337093 RepID=U2Z7S6_9RHOB|nr:H-NS histone family protein [Limimaricola cinnabarinus]GAD57117.1 trans-acting regulatory protein hvrA [Limimaricola cinnabarinus LL-001]